jgi:hypothetical protein
MSNKYITKRNKTMGKEKFSYESIKSNVLAFSLLSINAKNESYSLWS